MLSRSCAARAGLGVVLDLMQRGRRRYCPRLSTSSAGVRLKLGMLEGKCSTRISSESSSADQACGSRFLDRCASWSAVSEYIHDCWLNKADISWKGQNEKV